MASKIEKLESEIAEMQSVVDDPSTPSDIKAPLEDAIAAAKKILEKEMKSSPASKVSPLSKIKKTIGKKTPAKKVEAPKKYDSADLKKRCAELAKKYTANKQATAERAEKRRDQGKPPVLTPAETVRKTASAVQSKVVAMVKEDKKLDKQDSQSLSNGIIKTVQGILKGFKSSVNQKAFLSGLISDLQKLERKLPKAAMKGMKVDEGCGCMEYGGEVNGFRLKHDLWSKANGGNGISGTIRTCPDNYYVATIDDKGNISFNEIESMTKDIDKDMVKKLWESGQIKPAKKTIVNIKGADYYLTEKQFESGGSIEDQNNEMLHLKIKEIDHHLDELKQLVNDNTKVESWVVARATRAATDLSDVTHYIDGEQSKASMASGGEIEAGNKVIITTSALGKEYLGMNGVVTDRKLLNDKYSIKLDNGTTLVFSKDEFRHNSINPKFKHGGSLAHDYGNKTPKDVWDSWDAEQRKHFIADHFGETLASSLNEKDLEREGSEFYDAVKEHMKEGRYAKGGNTDRYNTGRSWHQDRRMHNKSEDYEVPLSERKDEGGSIDEWKAENGVVTRNGERVDSYTFDRDSDAFWIDVEGEQGQRSFETKEELINYFKSSLAKGGNTSRYNSGRSWHQDHNRHNKSESYEVPASQRKFAKGGELKDNWKVSIIKMQDHVTDKSFKNKTFKNHKEAYSYFLDVCDDLNIPQTWTDAEMNLDAGGRGYDYRIELEEIEENKFAKGGNIEDWAESISDKLIKHYLGDETEGDLVFSDSELINEGSFLIDKGTSGNGSKEVYLNIYFGNKFDQADSEINNDYEKFASFAESIASDKGYSLEIGTREEDQVVIFTFTKQKRNYADGGKVKFKDKVKVISKSLTGKTVPPKYKKQYGKKYSSLEAKSAATKIAGSMVKKEKKSSKKISPLAARKMAKK